MVFRKRDVARGVLIGLLILAAFEILGFAYRGTLL